MDSGSHTLRTVVRSAYGCGVALFAVATLWGQGGPLTTEQRSVLAGRIAAGVRQAAAEQERAASVPLVGVTINGSPIPGLFRTRTTGVPTAPIRLAAQAFLQTLTPEQHRTVMLPVESNAWRRWVTTGLLLPDGIALSSLSEPQRQKVVGLLEASLSARGAAEVLNVMRLNQSQVELTRNLIPNDMRPHPFDQWSYWLLFLGIPDPKEPWGWQLEGHHLVINFFVLGDQVVMTPTFLGAEPARATSGQSAGTSALQDKQRHGWSLFASLTPEQRTTATIRTRKDGDDGVAGAFQDNLVLEYAGIRASQLSDRQQGLLLGLIAEHVGTLRDDHARIAMERVATHLDTTYFAWIGGTDEAMPFYYRVQSPVILIEFDHPPMRDGTVSQNHIHTIVRTPNGNDYGNDLLRQHYAQHHHPLTGPAAR